MSWTLFGARNVAGFDVFSCKMAFWRVYWKTGKRKVKIEHTQWFSWKRKVCGIQKKSRRQERANGRNWRECTSYNCFSAGCMKRKNKKNTTTVLRPFFRDHPGEPVPEENFWTLWCKGRLTEADTLTIRLGATPSGLTSDHLHHLPIYFTCWMPFLPPNKQRQSTEGN